MDATEAQIQKSILDYLALRSVLFWRNNTGAYNTEYKGKKRFIRFGFKGSPDIFVVKEGKIYGIEIKTEKGTQNDTY